MGIIDNAVSISLVFTGLGLAAEVIEKKVPKLSRFTESAKNHPAYFGWFGVIGGILGLIVIPLFFIGTSAVGMSFKGSGIIAIILSLIGCVVAIYAGRMTLTARKTEASQEQTDDPQAAKRRAVGLFAIFYGLLMFIIYSVFHFM